MIKTKFKGAGHKPLNSAMASRVAGRPTMKDIVKHPRPDIKSLGYTNFSKNRPGKVSIEGKAKQV